MKLAIFAHCAVDTITIGDSNYEQIGGSACYCGLTAREFKFDVNLYTKFGKDFPKQYLSDNKINLIDSESEKNTTKFAISITGADRTLKLENECEPIEYSHTKADGHLVSPIYHEITNETLKKIKDDSNFLFVDPQGFLREKDSQNNVLLQKNDIDLSNISAIKVNPEEAQQLVTGNHDEMMVALQKKGVEYVLLTNKTEVSMLVKDKVYSITLPNKDIHDTTGIGDIFCAAFCCTMLKEKDYLWALCFAGGAAQAALDSKKVGLQKIPRKGTIQNNASYFYNLLKFRDL
ncbi:1-phosphofructokinase protein [Marine Group I thaumarchaeote SCGC AAA799-B03]|uniref:1-phosphofructokinase protein n=3 Tax=Marine Group I TaxID=905826 RepID=A0A087S695_9ARCH|nr:1-phosphofructokinase protein [Marine Group I thaumarchaeote SCGC AAA799-N04]KFM17676.1 ribokinase-like domain-containing protein [Marine Group I thaumarchaeote SCGC RSA3]KFM21249.1 1-phosphofructokinase protein [Marine Group I thaumarchaeote SCGC AAA799-B03]